MDQLIGAYKEYIVIEREYLNELIKERETYIGSKGLYGQGIGEGMERIINKIKENNIYNKGFEIHK